MSDLVATSYNESTGRIVGCNVTILRTFKFPTHVKEKRKKFWDQYFFRCNRNLYLSEAEESDDKTHDCVQFWVNTGHVSYNSLKSNTLVYSFSNSSLDTTAYIFSNANITLK